VIAMAAARLLDFTSSKPASTTSTSSCANSGSVSRSSELMSTAVPSTSAVGRRSAIAPPRKYPINAASIVEISDAGEMASGRWRHMRGRKRSMAFDAKRHIFNPKVGFHRGERP